MPQEYPVAMLEYGDEALLALLAELQSADAVGKKNVCNIPAAFDTEASSFYDEDRNKIGLCYIWMIAVNDMAVYGRTLDQFAALVTNINRQLERDDKRLIVYVHNLKYDFAFIKKVVKWQDVFTRHFREPLYARTGRIEFRDSLALSGGQSLARIGDKVLRRKIKKAVGDLDYNLIRTPETPMTQQELHYCEMDVRVLVQYIREKIEDDGDITKIPYTNTGYVRNYVRGKCFERRGEYMDFIDNLTMTPGCYLECEHGFSGGAVGANIKYVGKIAYNVTSRDIKSSYPGAMVLDYYPMSFFQPVPNKDANERFNELVTNYCCLFRLEVFNLVPKQDYCFPISESKCNELLGARVGGGRVISATYVNITITELDYDTIARFYDLSAASKVRVSYMRIAPRDSLPKPIVVSVLKFFHDKTTLDGVPGKEQEYMISKNMLNAIYGMMVEKPVREEYSFSDDFEKRGKDYERQVSEYNEKRNRFLFYPWGVWVTAHARHRLYDAIYHIGDDWRYCDTDCVKYVGNHDAYFERVNDKTVKKLYELAKRLNLPIDKVMPTASEYSKYPGKRMYLATWEKEYTGRRFKTLGAKRYLVEYQDGTHALTVAGPNKKGALEYVTMQAIDRMGKRAGIDPDASYEQIVFTLSDLYSLPIDKGEREKLINKKANELLVTNDYIFDVFNEGLTIPAEYAKRLISTFVDKPHYGYITDYTGERRWYEVASGIHMEPGDYSFSITDQMREAIEWLLHDAHYDEVIL